MTYSTQAAPPDAGFGVPGLMKKVLITHEDMMKQLTILTVACLFSMMAYGQTADSIAHTLLVADYEYTCHTSDAEGKAADISYDITLQVAQNMACTMGQKRHDGENDRSEQLLYVPTTWQNYSQGKMTSLETLPPYRYLTEETMPKAKWTLYNEHDTICGHPCQKATGKYGGRAWTVWFAVNLPTRFGPWRLNGLPGLVVRAVSEDGIHSFECRKVEKVKETVTYSVPAEAVRCTRKEFVKLRNRIFGNPNYISNPTYYIKAAELESVVFMGGTVIFGNTPINMKPAKFQPLDY